MKAIVTALLLAATLTAAAQTNTMATADRPAVNLIKALQSDNAGVVASAIFHTAKYDLVIGSAYHHHLVGELIRLANRTEDATMRERAILAIRAMQNPQRLAGLDIASAKDADVFFACLAERCGEAVVSR